MSKSDRHEVLLRATNLSKKVHSTAEELTILSAINCTIHQGTSTALVGRSGSGKTTLIGIMAGLDTVTSGEIYLLDKPLHLLDEEARAEIRANNIGFIFQNFQLLPNLTVEENVAFPLELLNIKDAKQKALKALKDVELTHRLDHYPSFLSGGEQQRVAIARAIANNPSILFADEPTGNLDNETASVIEALLFDLIKKINTTLVIVTHDKALASSCDQIIYLEKGTIAS